MRIADFFLKPVTSLSSNSMDTTAGRFPVTPVPGIRIVKYRTIFCRFIGKSQFFQVIAVRCFSDCQYLDHCGCLMFVWCGLCDK